MTDKIILRLNTFTKQEDFEAIKNEWEERIPNAIVIPHTFSVENLREIKGRNICDTVNGHCEFKCSVCGADALVVEGGSLDGGYFKFCPNCGVPLEEER